jgi:DNA-binding IclR family transcriptional regulator
MKLGQNQQAFLRHIRAEPGQWTAVSLAEDLSIQASSVRRSLRDLEKLGLVRPGPRPKRIGSRGGPPSRPWFPVDEVSS